MLENAGPAKQMTDGRIFQKSATERKAAAELRCESFLAFPSPLLSRPSSAPRTSAAQCFCLAQILPSRDYPFLLITRRRVGIRPPRLATARTEVFSVLALGFLTRFNLCYDYSSTTPRGFVLLLYSYIEKRRHYK